MQNRQVFVIEAQEEQFTWSSKEKINEFGMKISLYNMSSLETNTL